MKTPLKSTFKFYYLLPLKRNLQVLLSCKYVLKSSQKEQILYASRTERLNKVTGVNIVFGYAKQRSYWKPPFLYFNQRKNKLENLTTEAKRIHLSIKTQLKSRP